MSSAFVVAESLNQRGGAGDGSPPPKSPVLRREPSPEGPRPLMELRRPSLPRSEIQRSKSVCVKESDLTEKSGEENRAGLVNWVSGH